MIRFKNQIALAVFLLSSTGCGNLINCLTLGDNARGRVTFAANVEVRQDVDIVVEWSTNSFTSVGGRIKERNLQGLLSIPYSMCVDSGVTYQVRAYQDYNQNSGLDAGEPSGRMDGTSDGNAAFIGKTMPAYAAKTADWTIQEGIDVIVDTP